MKSKLKKILILILILGVVSITYLIKIDLKQKADAKKYKLAYHKSLSREDQLRSILKNYPDLAKYYAGSYLDESNSLHVNIVGDENADKLTKVLDNNKIVCHSVSYTHKQLLNAIDLVKDSLETYNIKSIGLNSKDNCLDIYLEELNEANKAKVTGLIKEDMVKFYQNNNDIKIYFDGLREYSENVVTKEKTE